MFDNWFIVPFVIRSRVKSTMEGGSITLTLNVSFDPSIVLVVTDSPSGIVLLISLTISDGSRPHIAPALIILKIILHLNLKTSWDALYLIVNKLLPRPGPKRAK